MLARALAFAGARVELTKAEMSAGDEGTHAELVGQGLGLLEVARCTVQVHGLALPRDVAGQERGLAEADDHLDAAHPQAQRREIIERLRILYDPASVLERELDAVRRRMAELGSTRVELTSLPSCELSPGVAARDRLTPAVVAGTVAAHSDVQLRGAGSGARGPRPPDR